MKRLLGRSGIEASALEMGCRAIGGPLWSGDTPRDWGAVYDESIRALHAALDVLHDNPDMIKLCEKHNLAPINRGPLEMGLLTGKYDIDTKPSLQTA